ncbi:MAG: M50 family metallopeptidase [Myxococcota bacterium]
MNHRDRTRASSAPSGWSSRSRAMALLVATAVVTLVLPHVPVVHYLAWPLMLLSTLAHELGHGVAAVLSGGSFLRFEMYADGSGAALTATDGRLQAAFTAAGGLVGPAFASMLLFGAARREKLARWGLGTLAGLLALALVLVVRNLFGFAFVALLVVALVAVVRFGNAWWSRFTLVFIAVNLALSVFTRGDYLFTETAQTARGPMPSDVAQMAEALLLPYWVWGAACGAISVLALALGLWAYLRSERGPGGGAAVAATG